MQGRFKMEYRLFTIVRYNYRDYNNQTSQPDLRNPNFTNTLYQLAYYQVLLQRLNIQHNLVCYFSTLTLCTSYRLTWVKYYYHSS